MSELLESTSVELRKALDPYRAEDVKVVQSGLMLFRQGMVSRLRYVEDDVLGATVQDVTPAKVELDLTFLGWSECSCPAEGVCRHIMAVFFAEYSSEGSVAEWVEEWREPVRESQQASKWGVQQAKELVKANSVLKPDYAMWVETFNQSFETLLRGKPHSSPYVIEELFQVYLRRVRAGAPLEPNWRLLYELIANVVSFQKLAMLSEELGHSELDVKRGYLHSFQKMANDCEDLIAKIGYQTMPFDFDAFVEKLIEDAFGLLTCSQRLEYERTSLYQTLWSDLFKNQLWREDENEKIREHLDAIDPDENPLPSMIAEIHLNLLLGEDDAALKRMNSMDEASVTPYMLPWIDLLSVQRAWKRVGPVIDMLLVKVKGYLLQLGGYYECSNFTRLALRAIMPYYSEQGRADVYERALAMMLPYSFYEYERVLFERGQYDRWAELYSFIGIDYSEMPRDRIKIVEKAQPEVLFGLLHQSAQQAIEMKNRQSYKVAVRNLKKLRTLYKKLKMQDDWQFFFDRLMEKTKRLRAFHEECRRGKLLDS